MSVTKKKRAHKISSGIHGVTHHPLSPMEKVLANKGQMQSIKHVEYRSPWRGVGNVTTPFNPKQVAENRRLYPNLFAED